MPPLRATTSAKEGKEEGEEGKEEEKANADEEMDDNAEKKEGEMTAEGEKTEDGRPSESKEKNKTSGNWERNTQRSVRLLPCFVRNGEEGVGEVEKKNVSRVFLSVETFSFDPFLRSSKESLDFGSVAVGEEKVLSLKVFNDTEVAVPVSTSILDPYGGEWSNKKQLDRAEGTVTYAAGQ